MGKYKKYLEPEYGEVAPEVEVMVPQTMDMRHTKEWRAKSDFESIAAITAAMKKCNCYNKLMKVKTEEIYVQLAGENVRVKIYIPADSKNHSVLIYYHGGAYSMNSIEVYEYVHRYFAYYGNLVVVAPDYHLAPEYKFPQGLNEAYETLLWTADNIHKFYGNSDDISIGGDSSGGNFAAVVAIMARNNRGPKVEKQILYYPLTTNYETEMTESEKRYQTGYFLEYNCMNDPMYFYFNTVEERKNPLASPLLAEDLRNLPDACFISAECDPLLDQGLYYAERLRSQGVKVEYNIMKGMVHGFLNWTYGKTFDAMDRAIEFINGK